jgi:hypothetical protein
MTELPELPYEPWQAAKDTLHLWAQIVGKAQLASVPPRNHWWHVTFRVDVRGIRSQTMRQGAVAFDAAFDLVEHRLVVRTDRGEVESFALEDGLSVAGFDRRFHELLGRLGIDVEIREEPFGVPTTTPFPADDGHASYDPEAAHRYGRALLWIDGVLREFAGWSTAKTSPVQLFWHSLDLAVTRFSGRRAPPLEGADAVTREAYSHEVVSFGFWPGDATVREPTFYSYAAPEPDGLRERPLAPAAAAWAAPPAGAMATLPYEAVRTATDPRAALLAFLQSAYEAGSGAAGWNREELVSPWCPTPERLRDLIRRSRGA